MFPLETVLLPGAHLPLRILEPRYRQLTIDLMHESEPNREFGIVTIRTPVGSEITEYDQVHPIGCAAQLREARRLDEGWFDIVTTGRRRFRLLDIDPDAAPYLIGTVEWIGDDPVSPSAYGAGLHLAELAKDAHRRYCESAWNEDWTGPPEHADLAALSYALASDCMLSHHDRQRLLAETHPVRRLCLVRDVMHRETGLLDVLRTVPALASQLLEFQDQPHLN